MTAFADGRVLRIRQGHLRLLHPAFATILLFVALSAAAPLAAERVRDAGRSSVYLVISPVSEYKVGGRVAIEPLFLTDGSGLKFVYDYCREIADGRDTRVPFGASQPDAALKAYCQGESVTIPTAGFHTLNNLGESVKLSDTEFEGNTEPGVATLRSITAVAYPPEIATLAKTTEYRFYIAAESEALLARLVPVVPPNPPLALLARDIDSRLTVANETAQERCSSSDAIDGWCKARPNPWLSETRPLPTNFFFVTLPGGSTQLVLGVRAERASQKVNDTLTLQATVLAALSGKLWVRGTVFLATEEQKRSWASYQRRTYLPEAVIRVNGCNYLLSHMYSVAQTVDLISLEKRRTQCPHLLSEKRPESDVQ